jgi:SnoaL-like domain
MRTLAHKRYGPGVVESTVLADLARHWDEGWNGADVDVIMAPFAPEVVFSSPFLPRLTGDPDQRTIDGAPALRRYVVDALARASDVRYTLHQALSGMDTVILVYTCHMPDGSDKPGADLMRVDGDGRVTEWRCHYATDPTHWRP